MNCSSEPTSTPSDAGVAGTGVLLGFIITAAVSIVLSASLIIQEQFMKTGRPSVVRRKLLNAYSDQQILTGIGIQSVGLVKTSTMIPYHFFIIWMLSLLSMAVHNATLLALVHDFRRDWVLRWLRQFLMFVNLVLSCIYGIFILRAVELDINETMLPIACVWNAGTDLYKGPSENLAASYAGTIAVIAGNVIIFALATWYLHSRTQRFYRIIQLVGLVLMTASAVAATVRVMLISQAFSTPPASVVLSDDGERQWSFGALLSVGLLILPVISVVEILRGEISCAPPVRDESDDDKTTLLQHSGNTGNELSTFQPNPFWGKRGNLSKT
ncbi:hypothetical protein BX600DRAFT_430654 [Xylariales sp. PMI_506]|nr:hypothetical protein BX600DRAFT_430654 [Xylariales sp. PMI_506]